MPGVDGIEATRRIVADERSPTRILILTTFDLDEYVYAALRAGASGFLLKDTSPDAADRRRPGGRRGRRVARAGGDPAARSSEFARAGQPTTRCRGALEALTAREREVLRLSPGACRIPRSPRELVVSQATAKTHVGTC